MRKQMTFALAAVLCAAVTAFAYPQKAAEITVSGYTGSALANFPVLVRISPERISGFSYADCATGGADIAFKDAQGDVLDREIDTWNTEGESLVWVRFPVLANNTAVTMTYKDPSATAQPACQTNGSVWAAAGYAGVWHFGEDSGTAFDSSPNGLHGTVNAGYEETCIATDDAKVGKGRYTPAAANLTLPNFRHLALGNTFTFSGWFKYDPAVTIANSSSPMLFYGKTTWNSTSDGWYVCLQWTSNSDTTKQTIGMNGAGTGAKTATIDSIKSTWVHVSVVFNNTTGVIYSNGASKKSQTITAAKELASSVMPKFFMSNYAGYGDEVRIRDAVNSADWVKAEYASVADAAFLTYGTAQNLSPDFIQVVGSPVEYSANNSPAYGTTVNPAAGTHAFTAPQFVEVSAGVRAYCTGWSLASVADGVETPVRTSASPASGEDDFTCVIDYAGAGGHILAWNWEIRYRATAAAETGGSVAPAEQWVASGATATVAATPAAGKSFYKWTNDVPASVSALSPSISFPVSAPVSLFASFGDILYVKEGGSDTNGGTSWDDAFATPEKALAVAPNGTMVVVGDGTYLINAQSLKMTNAVNMVSVNGPSVTTLRAYNAGKTFATGTSSTWRWVLEMRNAEAVVDGFTLENGRRYNTSPGASGLWLYNGLVRNCVIHDCRGGMTGDYSGGGVYIQNGTLADSVIYGNSAYYNNNSTGKGGGIHQSGGLVTGCVITNNGAGQYGCGVYISGGTMRNSLVARNHGVNSSYMGSGGAVFMEGGTVDSCVITGNVSYITSAGGVYLNKDSAVLRNCLVAGNRARDNAGGVLLVKGRVENCTITENASLQNGTSGTGLRQTGGTAVNNVIFGNETAAGASDTVVTAGTFKTNVVSQALSVFAAGDGNVAADPLFADPASRDWRLRVGSPAIDAACPLTSVKTDLVGVSRPQGVGPDIGCYEFVPGAAGLQCSFDATAATFLDSGSATFTAAVDGAQGNLSYAWYLDGALQESTGATASFASVGPGRHTVRLVVTDGVSTASYEVADVIRVTTARAYVATDGSDTYPYDTPEKAASRLQDALDAVWATDAAPGEVIVLPGDYAPDAKCFLLTRPIRVISRDGPGTTALFGRHPGNSSYRVMHITHAKAVLSGFTVRNGSWYTPGYGDSGPGGIRMSAGTITNCVIRNCRGDSNGGGVQMSDGLLIDCDIHDNYSRYNNDTVNSRGGGVYMTGGEIALCRIHANWACIGGDMGGGVWMSNGLLRDSVLYGNYSKNKNACGYGLAITGGTAERCVITNNCTTSYYPYNGGGVYLSGSGKLRNCLVANNTVNTAGGGVQQVGGTMEFCTVTANSSTANANSGLLMNGSSAVARYNILHGNGAGTDTEADCNIRLTSAASFATNLVAHPTAGLGVGNIYDAPGFADAPHGDWTLAAGSAAIDAAVGADWVTDDLAGNARPTDGNGDGTSAPDLGCYEAPDASAGPLRCAFTPDATVALGSATVTFTATASGTGSEGSLTYDWVFEGASSVADVPGDPASKTATWTDFGSFAVSLTVTAQNGAQATSTVQDCVQIGSPVIYVDAANANPVWPYDTWAKAATNLTEALDTLVADASRTINVIVTNGTYTVDKVYLALTFPLRLESVNGPASTTIRAAYGTTDTRRHFNVAHPQAFVSGFTLTGAVYDPWSVGDSGAASLRISAGVVSNCVVTGAEARRSTYGAVHVSGTGLLTHTVIRNSNCNKSTSSGAAQSGAGLALSGNGVAEYCVISNCYAEGAAGSRGGGAYVMGGVLRDSSIFNCQTSSSSDAGGVISQTGGLVERCVIGESATRKNGGAAIYQTGGTMRNCLVKGFVAKSATQVLQLSGSGSFVNNTVVTNGFGSAATSPVAATVAGGSVSNCLFAVNNGGDLAQTGGTVAHSRFAEAEGGTNISSIPAFRNPAKGDWRLSPASPGIDAGDWAALGETREAVRAQRDLSGSPRLYGRQVDLGCFETQVAGTMLFVR